VYPREVEAAIRAIPGVTAVLVVGEPHPRWGEAVVAYVESGDRALETTLRSLLSRELAPYKVPAVVHVVDALPRAAGPPS
jgi:acyl-CoA synthetase (AMP-forming)/AMP-acid ligase II